MRLRSEVVAVSAEEGQLGAVTLADADGNTDTRPARALFICIGGRRS